MSSRENTTYSTQTAVPARNQGSSIYSFGDSSEKREEVAEYIRNQLEEDAMIDQMAMKEYIDPFTGDKKKQA